MTEAARVEVVVADVDTWALLSVIEHLDDVIRELALIESGRSTGTAASPLPVALLETVNGARQLLYRPKEVISHQAASAWREGRLRVDVKVTLAVEAVPAIHSVLEAFEAVDVYAREDSKLLLPAAPQAVRDYRRWFFTALADNLARLVATAGNGGPAPVPPGSAAAGGLPAAQG
jgi:hypothetical protein